ncbi:hypothetical protein CDIK_0997 [Cucumispora dikerogammari]|nr:hypothetical protein CDIK_0997 [Cucumispora dikerogammari]
MLNQLASLNIILTAKPAAADLQDSSSESNSPTSVDSRNKTEAQEYSNTLRDTHTIPDKAEPITDFKIVQNTYKIVYTPQFDPLPKIHKVAMLSEPVLLIGNDDGTVKSLDGNTKIPSGIRHIEAKFAYFIVTDSKKVSGSNFDIYKDFRIFTKDVSIDKIKCFKRPRGRNNMFFFNACLTENTNKTFVRLDNADSIETNSVFLKTVKEKKQEANVILGNYLKALKGDITEEFNAVIKEFSQPEKVITVEFLINLYKQVELSYYPQKDLIYTVITKEGTTDQERENFFKYRQLNDAANNICNILKEMILAGTVPSIYVVAIKQEYKNRPNVLLKFLEDHPNIAFQLEIKIKPFNHSFFPEKSCASVKSGCFRLSEDKKVLVKVEKDKQYPYIKPKNKPFDYIAYILLAFFVLAIIVAFVVICLLKDETPAPET